MRFLSNLLLPVLLSSTASAIFADDAFHIDYHQALVGKPQIHTTLFLQPFAGSKASLLYTLSEQSVLAAINPKDGAVVWRQTLSPSFNSSASYLTTSEGQDTVVSAVDGQVAAWSSSDGRLVWEKQTGALKIKDLETLELADGRQEASKKDVLLLTEGKTAVVSRLDGLTGKTKWQYEDNSGDAPFQLSASATEVFYISYHGTFLGGANIKVTSLDPITGQKVDTHTLSSGSDISSPGSIIFAGANSASPLLAWTDKAHSVLKVNIIGTKGIASFNIDNKGAGDIESVRVHAPSAVNSLPQFAVQYQTSTSHWAEVYHIDIAKASIAKAYDIPKVAGRGTLTTSTVDANVYFTRITEDELTLYASTSHGILGRWPRKKIAATSHGDAYPLYGVTEAVVRSNAVQAVRSAIVCSNGDWTLIRNGDAVWSRPEGLATTVAATFVDLPEEEALAEQLKIEGHQNIIEAYIHRTTRHIKDLASLPTWLQEFPRKFVASFSPASDLKVEGSKKDIFGFRKLVVAVTADSRLISLDTGAAGKVLWNIDLATAVGATPLLNPRLEALPNGHVQVTDPSLAAPIVVNSFTGASAATLQSPPGRTVPTEQSDTVIEYTYLDGELYGHAPGQPSQKLWEFTPFHGETITAVVSRPSDDPVASIGKVLGDRRVLYKYLNPNLLLITAVSAERHAASIYLIDSVSGNLLHSARHENVDVSRPIPSTLSENWLAYSFTSTVGPTSSSQGYQLAVAELFESSLPDDRGPLGAAGNRSSIRPSSAVGDIAKPHVMSQTYHIAEEISHLSVTHTKQGITSRQLLAVLPESHSIVGIPRAAIDPRRTVGRDPTTPEQMEGLSRYLPSMDFDPKWYLNHKRDVLGVKNVIATPSSLESTTLVFAYGLDVFGTRLAPSFTFDVLGKDFNKIQMLLTVVALAVGVLVVAPLVRSKQINARWLA